MKNICLWIAASTAAYPISLLITFDNIPNATQTDAAIPYYYSYFYWINGWYLNSSTADSDSGYVTVLSSGAYIGLNRNGALLSMTTSTSSFNLYSLMASAAYQDYLHLFIVGNRGNTIVYSTDVTLTTTTKTIVYFNWTNLTRITFQSYYLQYGYWNVSGLGYQFAFDNINVTLFQ